TRCLPKPRPPARKSIHRGSKRDDPHRACRCNVRVRRHRVSGTKRSDRCPQGPDEGQWRPKQDCHRHAGGQRPFNLDEAKKLLATFAEAGEKAPALFPDNSKTGGDTAALPAIWENKADFTARLAKFASDSKAAMGATKDLDSFKIQITEVRKNCGGCHQT